MLALCISTACHGAAISLMSLGSGGGATSPGAPPSPQVLTILSFSTDDPTISPLPAVVSTTTLDGPAKADTRVELSPAPERPSFDEIPLPPPVAPVAALQPPEPLRALAVLPTGDVGRVRPSGCSRGCGQRDSSDDSTVAAANSLSENGAQFGTAEYLQINKPGYPREAKRRKQEGLVVLLVKLSPAGNPVEVSLKTSSGFPVLDTAARESVRSWRFVPARMDGEDVESDVTVPIRFTLRE